MPYYVNVDIFVFSNVFLSAISIISCFLLFFMVFRRHSWASALKIILIISIGDLYFAMIQLIAGFCSTTGSLCKFFQTSLNFSLWNSVMWSTVLSILSYRSLKYPGIFQPKHFFKKCLLVIIPASIFVSIYPLMNNDLIAYEVATTGFCYVTPNLNLSDGGKFFVMMLFQGIPITIAIMITCWCYIKEISLLREVFDNMGPTLGMNPRKLLWYPICQLLVYTPHTILNIVNVYYQGQPTLIILFFFLLEKLPGTLNTLVYIIMNRPFSKRISEVEKDDYQNWDDSPLRRRSDDKTYDPSMLIQNRRKVSLGIITYGSTDSSEEKINVM